MNEEKHYDVEAVKQRLIDLRDLRREIENQSERLERLETKLVGVGAQALTELVAPDCVNVSATRATYAAEVRETLKGYASRQPNDEEMHEMRSAFGTGTTVVDVLSGRRYAV